MAEEEIEGEPIDSNEFDIDTELNSLVENNVLPKVIADKLGEKIKEKNVKITKDQLTILANKLSEFIKTYKEQSSKNSSTGSNENKDSQQTMKEGEYSEKDLIQVFEKINDLQEKLEFITNKIDGNQEGMDQIIEGKELTGINTTTITDMEITGSKTELSNLKTDDILLDLPTDPESIIVIMNWLQYLIDHCGYENLSNILEYYVDIEWITDDVKISLIDYSRGIKQGKVINSPKNSANKMIDQLPSKNHIQSYMFIQKLKGIKFDKHFVDRVQSDISRISKKVDQFQQND